MQKKRSLLIGNPVKHVLDQAGISICSDCVETRSVPLETNPAYHQVIALTRFDFFSFLEFGKQLQQFRDLVLPGGELVLMRKADSISNDFFCFRTSEFFRTELGAAGEVDFEEISTSDVGAFIIVRMKNRRVLDLADKRRASLRHDSLARIFELVQGSPHPNFIWTATTTRCNIRCHTCSVRNAPPGSDMQPDVIDRIFHELNDDVEMVNVTGIGEPLFSRHWQALHDHVRSKPGRTLDVVTNAILLREEQVRDMMRQENPTWLCVSIDGATKETFEAIRDRAKWEQVTRAMEMIQRVRAELQPGDRFRLGISFVAIKSNAHELPELIRLCSGWGADWLIVVEMGDWETNREFFHSEALRFFPAYANDCYAKARAEAALQPDIDVSLPPDFSQSVINEQNGKIGVKEEESPNRSRSHLRQLSARTGIRSSAKKAAVKVVELLLRFPAILPAALREYVETQQALLKHPALGSFKRVKGYCSVVEERAYFHANGDVTPCCGMLETRFGNIMSDSFDSIWNSEAYKEFRIRNLLGYPDESCYYCTLSYGLPEKNPENYVAAHRLPARATRLLRLWRRSKVEA